jgi:ABC-2 type transport system ATP-binding protein
MHRKHMANILRIENLRKRFGSQTALDGVDLTVSAGQVFGLLGPNGSGKTTLLSIVLNVIRPDSGSFRWFADDSHPRSRIGALLETPNFYPYLSADENLALVAAIKRVKKPGIDALLEQVQLTARRKTPFRTYSLGMKQRLAIAACLIGDPDVLILDEPTNGLDPTGMIEVRGIIQSIAARGKTIVLASHMLDEVEKICSHVGIMKNGRLLASGPVGAILSDRPVVEIAARGADMDRLGELFASHPEIAKVSRSGDRWMMETKPSLQPEAINRWAFDQGITLSLLISKPRSLEREFLEITSS